MEPDNNGDGGAGAARHSDSDADIDIVGKSTISPFQSDYYF